MYVFYIFFFTYIVAVNFYAFWLVKTMNEESLNGEANRSSDGRLFLTGLLGGAITAYVCMFIFKYRLKSLFLMIVMPLLAVFNLYLFSLLFRSGRMYFVA